ncbi:MAG: hypothetical protein RLZZ142_2534 [Verrucomicrobiota bacterium]
MDPMPLISESQSLVFEPMIPPWGIGLGAVVLFALSSVWIHRERHAATRGWVLPFLILLRGLFLAGVGLALANPMAVQTHHETTRPNVALVVDTSASMRLPFPSLSPSSRQRWMRALGSSPQPADRLDDAVALLHAVAANLSGTQPTPSVETPARLRSQSLNAARGALRSLEESAMPAAVRSRVAFLRAEVRQAILAPLQDASNAGLESAALQARKIAAQLSALAERMQEEAPTQPAAGEGEVLGQVRPWLRDAENGWLGSLRKRTDVETFRFASSLEPFHGDWMELEADPPRARAHTDLAGALESLSTMRPQRPFDAVVLVTDGRHNADAKTVRLPETLTMPVFVVPAGERSLQRDIEVRSLVSPRSVGVGEVLEIQAHVHARLCKGDSTVVELLENGQVRESQRIGFDRASADVLATFRHRSKRNGTHEFAVRAQPVPGEASIENNTRSVHCIVGEPRRHMLIADGRPRWETRYLLNLFRREKGADLTGLLFAPVHHFGGAATAQPAEAPRALPATLTEWERHELVILGDIDPKQLPSSAQETLRQYVSGGGKLVVIAGGDSMPSAFEGMPLLDLLPVTRSREAGGHAGPMRVTPTGEGLTWEALRIAEDLPGGDRALWESVFEALPLHQLSEWNVPKPGSRVLLEATPTAGAEGRGAFLSTQHYGSGSVTFVGAPVTHHLRWRYGDRFHYQFWGQLVRALVTEEAGAGSASVRIVTDRLAFEEGEPVRVRLRLRGTGGNAPPGFSGFITARSGEREVARVRPLPVPTRTGEFEAVLEQLPAGTVKLEATGGEWDAPPGGAPAIAETPERPVLEVRIRSAEVPDEMNPPPGTAPFFTALEHSRTGFLTAPGALPGALAHLVLDSETQSRRERMPLWPRWGLLLALCGLLTLEWAGRKWAGLF